MRFSAGTYLTKYGVLYSSVRLASLVWLRVLDAWSEFVITRALGAVGKGTAIGRGVIVDLPQQVTFGEDCAVGPYSTLGSEFESGYAKVGSHVTIGWHCSIDFSGGLDIGDGSFISHQVVIYTHDHGHNPRSTSKGVPLEIGRNVWIGTQSIILPGVGRIGNEAVIGAGSVVTRPVLDGEIVAGNPARVIANKQTGTVI